MKTQLTWEECLDQVAKKYDCQSYKYWTEKLGHNIPEFATEEAADLYRNQPSSINKEELRKELNDELSEILDGEKQGNWSFECLKECNGKLCNGFCEEFMNLKNQLADTLFSKLSTKQREVDELKEQLKVLQWNKPEYIQQEIVDQLKESK